MKLDWLFSRPIAHRGLHDRARGIIENSLDAADAAIARGCAIECDVQMSADGEAFVFHDEMLDRLTSASGSIRDATIVDIAHLRLAGSTDDASIPALSAFLERIARRVPAIVEIKSRFDGDMRLAERAAHLVANYAGAVALKSFDPAIVAHLRRSALCPGIPLGLVAESGFDDPCWDFLTSSARQSMACLLHWRETRPDFLSYCVGDLPNAAVHLARSEMHVPVMTWTVRTPAQWDIAHRFADQAIFEGPLP